MNNCLFNQRYFLVGIGGISMSAIAEYLIKKGCFVSGSDLTDGFETKKLRSLGARIFIGHDGKNVFGSEAVIYNSAVKPDNPELYAARKLGLPVFDRVAFLNKIADGFSLKIGVAGCHGKTTATAMLAGVLRQARKKFLMHLGGEDTDCGNMYFSGNDIFLTEVCEFNRNIDRFDTDVSCVLNVGFDHADCYRDIEDIKNAYYYFLDRSDFRIVNADDEYLSRYGKDALSFGLYRGDIIARNVSLNGGMPEFQVKYGGKDIKINLRVYGEHNVYNALCAVAAGKLLGISGETVAEGLERFNGIKRRFEKTGYINGAEVVCDYAHHPTELSAAIKTMNEIKKGRVITVFQPHTYSRTKALAEEFAKALGAAENLVIFRTYAAREEYDEAGSAETLFRRLNDAKCYFSEESELKKYLCKEAKEGDTVLVLGAGDIYDIVKGFSSSYR